MGLLNKYLVTTSVDYIVFAQSEDEAEEIVAKQLRRMDFDKVYRPVAMYIPEDEEDEDE